MAYLKPQSPLQNRDKDYFYPLTTEDQILIDNKRLSDYSIISNKDINIILYTSQWVEINGQYEQSILIDDLTESYNVRAKLAYTDNYDENLLINENAAYIKYAKQNDDKITFYCLDKQPQVDLPIEMEVYI